MDIHSTDPNTLPPIYGALTEIRESKAISPENMALLKDGMTNSLGEIRNVASAALMRWSYQIPEAGDAFADRLSESAILRTDSLPSLTQKTRMHSGPR